MFFKRILKIKELELYISNLKREQAHELSFVEKQKDMEIKQAKELAKIEYEKKLNDQFLLYKDSLVKLQQENQNLAANNNSNIANLKAQLAKEYYDKMQTAIMELNLEGSAQSKFVQELSLKMFDRALEKPMPSHVISEKRKVMIKDKP